MTQMTLRHEKRYVYPEIPDSKRFNNLITIYILISYCSVGYSHRFFP